MFLKKLYQRFTNKPVKAIVILFLLFLLLLPLAVVVGQVLEGGDRLRSNKNTISQIIYPPGENPVGAPCTVTNTSATTDYFVPFKTATEWMAFKGASGLISGLSVSCGGGGCTFYSCEFKMGHPTSCTQAWSCSQYAFGYHAGNCIYWPQYGEFRDTNGINPCCAIMAAAGCVEPYCSEQDIPGGGISCTGGIDYNYCSSSNATQCQSKSQYCSYYCADTLCSTDFGNVWYDPDFEYCCNPAHISMPLVCTWANASGSGPGNYNRCDFVPPPWQAECTYAQ